jgi:hypothetical protein
LRIIVDLLIGIGNFIHKISNPLIFACIYILALMPTSLLLKIFKRDILGVSSTHMKKSYWIRCANKAKDSEYFKYQF